MILTIITGIPPIIAIAIYVFLQNSEPGDCEGDVGDPKTPHNRSKV